MRSNVSDVSNRRFAAGAATTNAKTPSAGTSRDRDASNARGVTFRDVLRAGGLRGLTVKEALNEH